MKDINMELKVMLNKAKKQNEALTSMTDSKVARLVNKECDRLMQSYTEENTKELYEKLKKEKEEGRELSIGDISEEILTQLRYKENVSTGELAELFNTTKVTISSINAIYGLTTNNDKALELYKGFFRKACENVKNTVM